MKKNVFSIIWVIFSIMLLNSCSSKEIKLPEVGVCTNLSNGEFLKQNGYSFIEESVGRFLMPTKNEKEFNEMLQQAQNAAIPVKACNSFIPKELKNLSKEQLKILFDWMVKGDGHRRGKNIIYFTVSEQLANDVQEIALKLGYGCSFRKRKGGSIAFGKYKRRDGYVLSLTKRKAISVNRKDGREWIDYDGFVYDITVPNHIIYVRRNGKAAWSGNCSDDGTTLLKYERERHDSANKLAEYWVKVPSVSSTADTIIYLYFRTTDTADGADPENVWDSGFKSVYHLKDATTSTVLDSTSNNNDGTKKAANEPAQADGKIGKAQDFDGTDDYINIGDVNSVKITVEAWIKTSGYSDSDSPIVIKGYTSNVYPYYEYGAYVSAISYGKKLLFFATVGGTLYSTTKYNDAIYDNNWHYIAGRYDGETLSVSIDDGDAATNTDPSGDINHYSTNAIIGNYTYLNGPFDGLIDEVRISNVARSAAWIKASYYSGAGSLLKSFVNETTAGNFFLLF